MKVGQKVIFKGATEIQTKWGNCDNPYKHMKEGDEVTIKEVEVHSWHTKLFFEEVPGSYNSACFRG